MIIKSYFSLNSLFYYFCRKKVKMNYNLKQDKKFLFKPNIFTVHISFNSLQFSTVQTAICEHYFSLLTPVIQLKK